MIDAVAANSQLFLLVFVRVFALLATAPMISSSSIPGLVRVALSLMVAALVFPQVSSAGYPIPDTGLAFVLLLVGEAFVGIITGFFLLLVFAAFQLAGQMFSLQMGFGASQVFDPLSQVQIPLMGQFLNLVAMLIFVNTSGFQKIFLIGVQRSFERMRAVDLVLIRSDIAQQVMTRLSGLFQDALVIAFPILGTLVLVYVTMGLLAKAAPQMNLLVLGFPISIGITFVVLIVGMPFLAEAISQFIDEGFEVIQTMYTAGQDAAIEAGEAAAP
ncbi:MAG: flagellar biosynthetic protein FliR [Spirochaetes bacterium]|nr:flagellar biosynthetic protein FliR [Spirochaetota bacterium]